MLDTKTQSFRWINMVLESLIECYTHMDDEEELGTPTPKSNSSADKVRSELYEWRRTIPRRIDLMDLINQEPTKTLHQFLHDSTRFQETTDRIHALMHTQQKAKNRLSIPTPTTKTQQEA